MHKFYHNSHVYLKVIGRYDRIGGPAPDFSQHHLGCLVNLLSTSFVFVYLIHQFAFHLPERVHPIEIPFDYQVYSSLLYFLNLFCWWPFSKLPRPVDARGDGQTRIYDNCEVHVYCMRKARRLSDFYSESRTTRYFRSSHRFWKTWLIKISNINICIVWYQEITIDINICWYAKIKYQPYTRAL